jgi:hypothetical protein
MCNAALSAWTILSTHDGTRVSILMPCAAANATECLHTNMYRWKHAGVQVAYLWICWVHILGIHRICQGHRQLL